MSEKDDYWFKRKRTGWGWTPSNYKGWLVMFVYAIALGIGTMTFLGNKPDNEPSTADFIIWLGYILLLLVLLFAVASKKGPKPRWQKKGVPTKKSK